MTERKPKIRSEDLTGDLIANSLNELSDSMQDLKDAVMQMAKSVGEMARSIDRMSDRIDTLSQQIAADHRRMIRHDDRLGKLERPSKRAKKPIR